MGALVLTVAVFSWSCTARRAYALVEDPDFFSVPDGDGEGLTSAEQRPRRKEKRQIMVHERAAQLLQAGDHAGAMKLASQRLIWLNDQPPLAETWAKRLREREQGRLFSIISFGMLENGNMVSRKASGCAVIGSAQAQRDLSFRPTSTNITPQHPHCLSPPSRIRVKRHRSSNAPSSLAGRRRTG